MTSSRFQLLAVIYAMLTFGVVALFIATVASGAKPLALDFDPYWSAAQLALEGHARDAYSNVVIEAFERAHTRMDEKGYLAFYYPPPYLLLCLPLGFLPYVPALLGFLAAQATVLWGVLTRILRPGWAVLPVLAYPGFLMNFLSGQNGGFSAACFGGALLLLERRPGLAGACLGFLVCKPQIALAVPLALFAARRWRAAFASAATAAALCAVSWLALGSAAWTGFFANAPAARGDLESLSFKWRMMQSFYADIRIAGGDLALGYAGQALLAAVAVALLVRICWQRRGAGAEMAALSVTALLVTPFLYDYDLMVAAPALAWLTAQACRTRFLRGEAALLLVLYFMPFLAVAFGRFLGVPLAPPFLLALLLAISRRAEQQTAPHPAHAMAGAR
jgi:hypothetical protein